MDIAKKERQRGCFLLILITAFFIFATTLWSATADEPDLEFVLNGIKYNDSLVENCGVKISYTVEVTTYPEGSNAFRDLISNQSPAFLPPLLNEAKRERYEYDIILKGEQKRVEEKWREYRSPSEQYPTKLIQHRLWTYNGEKTRQIYYPEKAGIKPQAVISNGAIFSSYSPYRIPLTFEDFTGGALSQSPEMKLTGKTSVDGHECYLLERTDKSVTKIWVAPEFGFRPIQYESDTPVLETTDKIDYEQHNGIWAVMKYSSKSFLKTGSDRLKFSERELTVNKIEFICPPKEIPDSVFSLDFPAQIKQIWDSDKEEFIANLLAEKNEADTSVTPESPTGKAGVK